MNIIGNLWMVIGSDGHWPAPLETTTLYVVRHARAIEWALSSTSMQQAAISDDCTQLGHKHTNTISGLWCTSTHAFYCTSNTPRYI